MEEIVVTATREKKPLKDAPGAVTVITKEEIAGKNALDLAKVLEDKTGLRVLCYGGLGSSTSLQMRGLYGRHTLIMVDDRILNAPNSGEADLSNLSIDNVERIEVVRGPVSALYGGNAVSGVVNIITKNPPAKTVDSFSTLYGTYQTTITQLSSGANFGKLGYLFTGNYKSSEGHRDNSAYHAGDSHLKLDYAFSETNRLTVDIGNNEGQKENPGARPAKDPSKRKPSQLILGNSRVSNLHDFDETDKSYLNTILKMGNLKLRTYLNSGDDDNHREWIWLGDHYSKDSNFQTISYGSELMAHWDVAEQRGLTLGLNVDANRFKVVDREENITAGTTTPLEWDTRRGNYAAFIQNEINLGEILLTLGGRWDNPTDFESQFSAKANLLWHLEPTTTLRVSAGDSYRAPSLNDLNWPKDDSAEGNPDLIPEIGRSYELGLQHTSESLKLTTELNLFRQTLTDMIAWAPTGSMGPWGNRWKPDNVNKAWNTGLELGLTCRQVKDITFNLNYTWLEARQRNKESRCYISDPITFAVLEVIRESETRKLAYVPSHKVDLGSSFAHFAGKEDLFLDLGAQYVAPTYQYYEKTDLGFPITNAWTETKKFSSYWLANLKLRKIVKNLEFSLGVENLFNKEYTIQAGSDIDDRDYPMPGRMVVGGLSVRF